MAEGREVGCAKWFDVYRIVSYNKKRRGATGKRSALLLVERRIPRLSCEPEAGNSYFAFNATMQIVTRKTNDKKSYRSISNAPAEPSKKQARRRS